MGATGAAVFAAVASAVVTSALAPKPKGAPSPQDPTPAPAPNVAADSSLYKQQNSAVASSQGPASTLLTGLAGVPNASLNLGRNTSLGT